VKEVFDMASLADSNPYLKNSEKRRAMIAKNTFDSSVFEGASPRSLGVRAHQISDTRRSKATVKKRVKAS